MDSELLNELITVHLRYTPGARPLRTRAIAQMAAKILYTLPSGEKATTKNVTDDIGVLLDVATFSEKDVIEALHLPKGIEFAEDPDGNWRLSVKGERQVKNDIAQSRTLIDSVLDRHFPHAIPREQLRPWFRDICAQYFGRYGTYWATSLFGGPVKSMPAPALWKNISLYL